MFSDRHISSCAQKDHFAPRKYIQYHDFQSFAQRDRKIAQSRGRRHSDLCGSKKAQFIFDGTTFQTRLLDGTFPDVERIIPQHFISTLQIDARELSNAIDRTNFILTDKVHLIKLECTPKIVEIKTRSSEIGDSKEELLSSIYGGEDLTLTCNGSYMLDALKALGSSRVELSLQEF